MGFEPMRPKGNSFLGCRLNHSTIPTNHYSSRVENALLAEQSILHWAKVRIFGEPPESDKMLPASKVRSTLWRTAGCSVHWKPRSRLQTSAFPRSVERLSDPTKFQAKPEESLPVVSFISEKSSYKSGAHCVRSWKVSARKWKDLNFKRTFLFG